MKIHCSSSFRDNDVHPSDVCLLRHSLFAMNIMQISGYFKVDQIRWEQEGIASQFDGELCKKMIEVEVFKVVFDRVFNPMVVLFGDFVFEFGIFFENYFLFIRAWRV